MHQFIGASRFAQTSILLTRDGTVYGPVHEENRICVSLGQIAEPVIRTLLAVEDRRFFCHNGLDYRGIVRATYVNFRALRLIQGGSTITQQLARMAVLRRHDRTLRRKVLEAFVAVLLERQLTKQKILENYLNAAYFGHNIYGIELAALTYCGKPAVALNEIEAAYLIGLLKAPARYCRCCNPVSAARRTELALSLAGAKRQPLPDSLTSWKPRPRCTDHLPLTGGYVSLYVRRWLKQSLSTHYPAHRLRVHTTVEPRCQLVLESITGIVKKLGYAGRVACIVQDAKSGAIRALSGGIDCQSQGFNSATDGYLQPGSLLKPFVLLAALNAGIALNQRYESRPLTVRLSNGKLWSVRNAGGRYVGWTTVADALVVSDNTVYAQLMLDLGLHRIRDLLSAVGIPAHHVTTAISTGAIRPGVSPLQMCAAYSVFSSGGTFYPSTIIGHVLNEQGTPIVQPALSPRKVCSSSSAAAVTAVLKRVNKEGTGALPEHHTDLAAKTGTSVSGGWYVGFGACL